MELNRSSRFLTYLRQVHLVLGTIVSLPILAWSLSGFFLAIPPGTFQGEAYRSVDFSRVVLEPEEAAQRLQDRLPKTFSTTAMTLEQRGENPRYSLFVNGRSIYVDAYSGTVDFAPPLSPRTRWVRNAHFFNFAGSQRTALLLGLALMATFSTLSGIILLMVWFFRLSRGPKIKS